MWGAVSVVTRGKHMVPIMNMIGVEARSVRPCVRHRLRARGINDRTWGGPRTLCSVLGNHDLDGSVRLPLRVAARSTR